MKARVNKITCIGCGLCCDLAPASFELDEEFKSVPKEAIVADEAKCQEATDGCPVKAITIED